MTWSAWLIFALVIGGVGYLSLAGFVWANRQGIGSRPLIVMLLAVKVWSICYALELSSRSVHVAECWSAGKYVGICALPPALWSFVLAYTGKGKLSRRNLALLMIHPVVVLTLLAIPATHPLLQNYDTHVHLLDAPVPTPGPLFWPHAAYVYILMLAADFTLLARLTRIAPPYRRQGALLIAASLLPCFGNIAFNLNLFGQSVIDPTPFLFGVTAVVLVWGFFRLRLLDLTPVARGIVIEQMADGVLVLDVYGRVADANAAGAAIVGYPRRSMVGRYVTDIVPGLASILEKADVDPTASTLETEVLVYPTSRQQSSFGDGERQFPAIAHLDRDRGRDRDRDRTGAAAAPAAPAEPILAAALSRTALLDPALDPVQPPGTGTGPEPPRLITGPPRDVAVSLTAVTDPIGRQIARLVVLRDVTERNRTERQLRDLLDEQTRLSETLRQSLRPAELPHLPGLRLAARSVPSARGGGVGGDFYDVHSAGEGVSAFVLGDVSGKGVHAAVVTSMARYTVRTLSAQGWSPGEVLEQLNRALQTPDDLERFCTVVYGQVRLASAEPMAEPAPSRPVVHPFPAVQRVPADDSSGASAGGPGIGTTGGPAIGTTVGPAIGTTEQGPSEPVSGVRLVLTLGGHPPPLLRRRDRSVQAVGVPGTALGLLPSIDVREVTVHLASGDVLLAYTDGVTEARDGDEQFGEERLAGVLAAVDADFGPGEPGSSPAGQLADAVADAVLRAVRAFSSERDDVALLVLAAT